MEEYIEVPLFGGIFPSSDINFVEMVQMDGKSMQNMCRVNRESREFCSDKHSEFWMEKYNYFAKGIDIPIDWKEKWIHLYTEVREDPKRYMKEAFRKDKPSFMVIVQKCNVDEDYIKKYIKQKAIRIKWRMIDYLLANIYVTESDQRRFKKIMNRNISEWGAYLTLNEIKILYKYGILVKLRDFCYPIEDHIDIFKFYLEEGAINLNQLRKICSVRSVKDYRALKKLGLTPQDFFPDTVEDLFHKCDYKLLIELFNDGLTMDDLRNVPPYDDGTPYLVVMVSYIMRQKSSDTCVNIILSKMRQLGMTVEELNAAMKFAAKAEDEEDEDEEEEEGEFEIPFAQQMGLGVGDVHGGGQPAEEEPVEEIEIDMDDVE
uniref:Uncharacterized protein n=1 Tax=Marseillevirus LCMAC101 TaxID=2506602 RepID=A0A481YT22_9VIRU|nr:MAG: hypothetical protein LCMAC101_02310 [Marseillevirus LCMAC101]